MAFVRITGYDGEKGYLKTESDREIYNELLCQNVGGIPYLIGENNRLFRVILDDSSRDEVTAVEIRDPKRKEGLLKLIDVELRNPDS